MKKRFERYVYEKEFVKLRLWERDLNVRTVGKIFQYRKYHNALYDVKEFEPYKF